MSEEEKKAIEVLKSKRPSEQMLISGKMCVDILINLIEKQDKMIDYYKEREIKVIKVIDKQIRCFSRKISETLNIKKERPLRDAERRELRYINGRNDECIEIRKLLEE